ncbi:hypothetical protein V8G56_09805, partial [Gaetbulibacter aquiaggeris]
MHKCVQSIKTTTTTSSFTTFLLTLLLFVMLPFTALGQCPNTYVSTPTVGTTAGTITFNFEAGNGAADQDVACDFVRAHGGTGTNPCSGGSITVAGITYNYTGNNGGGTSQPIVLTYTAATNVTTAPTDFQIAEGIGCGQTSDDERLSIIFQDIETGQNCTSSNSYFSMTLIDNGFGPYTLLQSGNSALVFGTDSYASGTYTTATIKAGIYILVFTDASGKEHSFIYNHITQIGTCLRQSNLDIVKTITSGDPYYAVGDIITYSYAVTSDAPITNPFVTDDHIIGNITTYTGDSNSDGILQVGEIWTFSGTYMVTQDDINNGSVTNLAFARGLDENGLPIFSEVDNATATLNPCSFEATCNLDPTEKVIEGCDITDLPSPFTNAADVFSGITTDPCGDLVLKHDDVPSGTLCPDGLSVVRTYTLFDDLNNNQTLDVGEEFEICVGNFKIVDTTAPTWDVSPSDMLTVECDPAT